MEKRKRGHPPLQKNIEEYVITAAMKNPEMKRLALAEKVTRELKDRGLTPPAQATMLKLFQKSPDKTEEDKPWSVGKSLQYDLPVEATGDLLDIWASCLAAGREFTIRQARWVCYLRFTHFLGEEILTGFELYYFAVIYANRERICQALKTDTDTFDLDISLRLRAVEQIAALRTGDLNKLLLPFPRELPKFGINKPDIPYGDVVWTVLYDLGIDERGIFKYSLNLPEDFNEADKELGTHVYAYWLRAIGKAPAWANLSNKARGNIILKLKQNIETELNTDSKLFRDRNWSPIETLNAAGLK